MKMELSLESGKSKGFWDWKYIEMVSNGLIP